MIIAIVILAIMCFVVGAMVGALAVVYLLSWEDFRKQSADIDRRIKDLAERNAKGCRRT